MRWYILCYVFAACQLIVVINEITLDGGDFSKNLISAILFGALGYFLQKQYEKKQAQQNANEGRVTARADREIYECKVAGVTFKNSDGSDRQDILKHIYETSAGTTNDIVTLKPYKFEGDDAIRVVSAFGEIGNIPAKCVNDVMELLNANPFVMVRVSEFEDDEGETKYAGLLLIDHDPIQK